MRLELDEMIERFRSSQDRAVETLRDKLEIPLPESNFAWAHYCREQNLYGIELLMDVPFHAHGYGVQIEIEGVRIDFDWGDEGQPDGFDGWRLWWHYSSNNWPPPGTHSEINRWLAVAHASRQLEQKGSLYYDPKRRAL